MRCHLRSDVCNKLFLSFGAFDWHQKQVDTAWALGQLQGQTRVQIRACELEFFSARFDSIQNKIKQMLDIFGKMQCVPTIY